MDDNLALNARQIKFCEEYVVDYNATGAALRAGYGEAGARSIACKLLKNESVKQYVAALKATQREANAAVFEEVKEQLMAMAFSNIADFIGSEGDITKVNINDISKMRGVESFHISKGHVRLKMYDKLKALKLLAKHMGFYEKTGSIDEYVIRTMRKQELTEEVVRKQRPQNPEAGDGEVAE